MGNLELRLDLETKDFRFEVIDKIGAWLNAIRLNAPNEIVVILYLIGESFIPNGIANAFRHSIGLFGWVRELNGLVYAFIFSSLIFLVCRKGSILKTWQTVVGKSRFSFLNRTNLLLMLGFLVILICLRLMSPFHSQAHVAFPDYLYFHFCILVPLIEEVLYRGIIQGALSIRYCQSSEWKPILLGSLIFASVHDFSTSSPIWIVPFGLVLGLCYSRFRSVPCCMFLHSVWNFFLFF